MKTIVLILTGMLFSISTVTASEINSDKRGSDLDITKQYRYTQPISFVERGIEFLIFPDGSFDFNTNNHNNANYYNNSRRSSVNVSYQGPNAAISYSSRPINTGVYVERDRNGLARRIGDVHLNYDRYGNITQVGSVYINYNRGNGFLRQVGGLTVNYNHWGEIVGTRGHVNHYNRYVNYNTVNNNSQNDHCDNDDNYYYFKQNGKIKKQKKENRFLLVS